MKTRFDARAFEAIIPHDSDLNQTYKRLQTFRPTHVIAGSEPGVELADQLGQCLGLPGNDPLLREARRDKFLMNEAARKCGLEVPVQFQSDQIDEILQWIQHTLDWPVIVKPPKSVASDQVFNCVDQADVRRACEAILSSTNILGERNQAVLIQEYLEGTEFALDVVSYQGRKKTTAIWQYSRRDGDSRRPGYDTMTLLPYAGTRQQALQSFAFDLIDALGIRFGPAHCELMWVDDRPVLIEVGARLTAGDNSILSRICGGICALDETIDVMLDPDRFLETLNDPPSLHSSAVNLFLGPARPGRLIRLHGLDAIRELPTLYRLSIRANPGDMLDRVVGLVTLVGEDASAIERDINLIHTLESKGIFEVQDEAPT